jgi:hypothetical protein
VQRFVQSRPGLAVGHAGWINAALWLCEQNPATPTASTWPRAVRYGTPVLVTRDIGAPAGPARRHASAPGCRR